MYGVQLYRQQVKQTGIRGEVRPRPIAKQLTQEPKPVGNGLVHLAEALFVSTFQERN